ncbi:MAG: 16S rRNA (adenine(1518)-N(6)/adenine(1519)-N(6))-dimethyltransferase RsmA [Clostridiales bacterium]|nr:16S rRNA (adenine(1518)-N(6)/adenine(1519)-N(6))-dimethyltransferase RsmA [Clostridiales bacterium]
MEDNRLIIPANTIAILKKHNLTLQKKFGQNFLIDSHVLDKIIRAAEIGPSDMVLEIGPGIGTMTQALSGAAGKVVAVEIDRNLIPVLKETLADCPNAEVINADVMELDLAELIREKAEGRNVKVTANLPYYITTPIIMKLLEEKLPISNITVMVQKEVAERMQAGPGSKDYGALSLAVAYYAEANIAAFVPPNCFIPRPKVGSAVICLTRHKEPVVKVKDENFLFQVIRASFRQRRKTLANGLKNAPELSLTRDMVESSLREMGLLETVRGETLTLEEFGALADILLQKKQESDE